VADPPYTKASNQQSYQQLLWKSFLLSENCRFFLVCAFELFTGQNFFQQGMMRLNSQLLTAQSRSEISQQTLWPVSFRFRS
jgi:hypothetical protein